MGDIERSLHKALLREVLLSEGGPGELMQRLRGAQASGSDALAELECTRGDGARLGGIAPIADDGSEQVQMERRSTLFGAVSARIASARRRYASAARESPLSIALLPRLWSVTAVVVARGATASLILSARSR